MGIDSYFAPAGRATSSELDETAAKIVNSEALQKVLDGIPDYAMVLNHHRQVVACNTILRERFSNDDLQNVIGMRPGEVVGCINALSGPDGCGTGVECEGCGAVTAIVESLQHERQVTRECSLVIAESNVAVNLMITCTPIELEGTKLVVSILKDIGDEKRRALLERMFFHDVINTAGGIRGLASALVEGWLPPEKTSEYQNMMRGLADRLVEEITMQRKLLAAEKGEFVPELGLVSVPKLMRELQVLYGNHDIAKGRKLVVQNPPEAAFISDRTILCRILGNLVKNALEATPEGGTVVLSAEDAGDDVIFHVNNPGIIPREVQLQLFRRSFSTKGDGRGLGTYCVRLFGERYLKGRVSFRCCETEGTTFSFSMCKKTFMTC